jgi:hypothetical protein
MVLLAVMLLVVCSVHLFAYGEPEALYYGIEKAPVLDKIETTDLVYTRGSGSVFMTATLTVADNDNNNLRSAIIRFKDGYQASEDVLRFTNQNSISGLWDPVGGVLTLTGRSTLANYQKALRSIRYENTNTTNPAEVTRVVSFQVNDGLENSNTLSRNIIIKTTCDPPATAVISGNASICKGAATDLHIALTGTPPWRFSYRRNSENPVEIKGVMTSPSSVSVNKDGTYTLFEVYDANCMGTVSGSALVEVTNAPEVTISGLAPVYNKQSTEWVPITGTPSGGIFSGPGVIPYNTGWFFVPSLPPVGTHTIVYEYNPTSGNCIGYDSVQVRVLEADAIIVFENERTNYCLNDHPFTISGVNLANATGTFTISGDAGLVDHHNNMATVYPAQLLPGSYTITYTYYDGTYLSVQAQFEIGSSPAADFTWSNECFHAGQSITFTNKSKADFGFITGYNWKIFTPNGTDYYTTPDVTRTFPQTGKYRIDLMIETSYGCTDTATRELGLRPVFQLTEPYTDSFEDSPLNWLSGTSSQGTVNSWKLGNPSSGFSGAASGTKCWYTDITGPSAPREQSWVTSPCFDFTGIEKPMVRLKIWRLFNNNRDGANLLATIDNGKTWTLIGEIDDGINWFNSYSILGNPGTYSVGWSSNSQGVGNDSEWTEALHSLDMLKGKKDVQFRIAYGSDFNAQGNHGIAFDDFRIVDRTRMALLEHFTNSSYEPSEAADAQVNTLVNANELNIVDLQYHTSFPGPDPFNQDNPSVPSARAFYYGLSSVPYTILNGGSEPWHRFDYEASPLDQNAILLESLSDSKFSITLTSSLIGHTLDVEAGIFALEDIPATELIVRLAVTEQQVNEVTGGNGETSFESVVRSMLPDAAGTTIYQAWQQNIPLYVSHTQELDNYSDEHELRVIAFIQNESTGEVYQVAKDTIGTINAIPGINHSNHERLFTVFPNPAPGKARVRFHEETGEEITLELYNNAGGLVMVRIIPAGTTETEISAEQFPEGLYLLRLVSRSRLWGITPLAFTQQH